MEMTSFKDENVTRLKEALAVQLDLTLEEVDKCGFRMDGSGFVTVTFFTESQSIEIDLDYEKSHTVSALVHELFYWIHKAETATLEESLWSS